MIIQKYGQMENKKKFYETDVGKELILKTIPSLIVKLENLGKTLEKINDILNEMNSLFLEYKKLNDGRNNTKHV
jgi:ribosome-binding factor A